MEMVGHICFYSVWELLRMSLAHIWVKIRVSLHGLFGRDARCGNINSNHHRNHLNSQILRLYIQMNWGNVLAVPSCIWAIFPLVASFLFCLFVFAASCAISLQMRLNHHHVDSSIQSWSCVESQELNVRQINWLMKFNAWNQLELAIFTYCWTEPIVQLAIWVLMAVRTEMMGLSSVTQRMAEVHQLRRFWIQAHLKQKYMEKGNERGPRRARIFSNQD